jgi:tyrosine phenol-lyase
MSIAERVQVLELTGHNLDLVPSKHIELDFQTDSLMHTSLSVRGYGSRKPEAPEQIFTEIFGFPYVMAVSQGRLAEAILSHALVRNGHYIPGSALFPTTRTHLERQGGTLLEVMCAESLGISGSSPFKGNLDLEALERMIKTYHAGWIPFIGVEPCNNAVGGHPMSMANMRSLAELAHGYDLPVYLDGCRLVDNAVMIQEREAGYQDTPIDEIIREFCSYADYCTMSATKDFPTSVGAFLAVRDVKIFYRCLDCLILFGAGLSADGQEMLARAIADFDEIISLVRRRVKLVQRLHQALSHYANLVQPVGGHGVFLNIAGENKAMAETAQPAMAFLYQLFRDYGIRGAVNYGSRSQIAHGINLVRFAIPILGVTEEAIAQVAEGISTLLDDQKMIQGLKIVQKGSGLTGFLRDKYQPLEKIYD